MKKLIFTLPLLAFVMLPAPAEAYKRTCTKEVYKEEYIPGKKNKPGRVESKWITKEVPCKKHHRHDHHHRYGRKHIHFHTHDNGTLHSHPHRHGHGHRHHGEKFWHGHYGIHFFFE